MTDLRQQQKMINQTMPRQGHLPCARNGATEKKTGVRGQCGTQTGAQSKQTM